MLYAKLVSPPACGSPMPLGGQPFDETQLACVKTWIQGLQPGSAGAGGAGGAGGN